MATVEPSTFGSLLRRHRLAAGLTQAELAERAGISVRSVSNLERLAKRPHPYTVSCLADALLLGSRERTELEASLRRSRTFPHTQEAAVPRGDGVRVDGGGFPLLVGRDRELGLIQRQLGFETMGADALLNERPSMLVLTGEPGIGKSRLLAEASRLARASGWQMLSGGCVRRSGAQPYAPFVDLLALTITQSSPAQQQHDLAGCSWLVRLLPELAETRTVPSPQWQLPPEQERRLIFAAVGRYLHNIAGPSGTLLLLDDLQWAGQDTLDLLDVLARGTLSDIRDIARQSNTLAPGDDARAVAPVRMIVACRDTELRPDHPFAMLVADLAREGRADIHQLEPLSPQEAGELARSLLDIGSMQEEADAPTSACMPDELATTLAQRTGGRPYFLMSCAQAVRAARAVRASWDASQDAAWGVPWNVSASIHQRVAALPGAAQDLLSAAAIAGRHASRGVLLQVGVRLEIAIPDLLAALEALDRARLLLAVGPDSYEFAHDLVREVVAADLSSARGAVLHGWIAEALETGAKHKPHPAELAWHFQQAGEPMRALPYALAAGDQAEAVCAHAEAERHYRAAAKLAAEVGDCAREAEACEKLVKVLVLLARYGEIPSIRERAILRYQQIGDRKGELRSLALFLDNLPAVALERVGHFLSQVELEAESAYRGELAAVYNGLAQGFSNFDRYQDMKGAATRAEELARAQGDDAQLLEARFWRGAAVQALGELRGEQWLQDRLALIPLAERFGELYMLCRLCSEVASVYCDAFGDFARATEYLERALDAAERRGGIALILNAHSDWMIYHYFTGAWDRAEERGRHASALRDEQQSMGATPWGWYAVLLALGTLGLAQGRHQQAEVHFEQAMTLVPLVDPDLHTKRYVQRLLAERDLLAREAVAAHARLHPLLDRPGMQEPLVPALLPFLAWAQLALNRDDEAAATLEACKARCGKLWLVDALRVEALLAIKQQRWQDGVAALNESLTMCRALPYPHAEAKALYIYGQLHSAQSEPELAGEKYEQALAICERLGEGLYRPHLERALAALQENVRAQ